jgi:hypothetical protein
VTTLEEIRRLATEASNAMHDGKFERDAALAVALRRTAHAIRAEANDKLRDEPLEVTEPTYGHGVLVGVNPSGWGVFHPDGMDTTVPVDLDALRETQ